MAGASRTELLQWLNELLQLNYTKHLRRHPMARVKMQAKHEYEYVANYKIMQNVFKAKKIDKPIPVEKLVKCKCNNLEFLQWLKRFWDANFAGGEYDAVGRRKGAPSDPPATLAPIHPSSSHAASSARAGGRTPVRELTGQLEGLEKERDFYFEKLRDIEILAQQKTEALEVAGAAEDETLKEIQKICIEGFEVPDGEGGGVPLDEEETF
ncbi:calponin homology domain-containing protein [Mycena leptocephala]|nr:calponin homology domain-containing protein [Mycena leptocephala]